MNLSDLLGRREGSTSWPKRARRGYWHWGGQRWRTVAFPAGKGFAVRIAEFHLSYPNATQPDMLGWYATCTMGRAKLEVTVEEEGEVLSRALLRVGREPVPVPIPWPILDRPLGRGAELILRTVRFERDSLRRRLRLKLSRLLGRSPPPIRRWAEIEILVHRMLDRQELLGLAKGTGVEIGPGPRPKIHPGPDVDVTYVEEMPREKWIELYDSRGKYDASAADWSRVQTGKAIALPVEDDSLDFIFLSHVFEHLANPLGHLAHWRKKLKRGGRVLAIVPQVSGSKDRFMPPTPLAEMIGEYEAGITEPRLSHYERHVTRLGTRAPDPERAQALLAEARSIHVHFYDRPNTAEMLGWAVEHLDYSSFRLVHTANHKDFFMILTA